MNILKRLYSLVIFITALLCFIPMFLIGTLGFILSYVSSLLLAIFFEDGRKPIKEPLVSIVLLFVLMTGWLGSLFRLIFIPNLEYSK